MFVQKRSLHLGPILLIAVGLCLSSCPADAQVAEQDSLALVAFYNATNGSSWTNDTNWLSGPVSTWIGVTLSGGYVSELVLRKNLLAGMIPEELVNLTNLTALDLYLNDLSGPIPKELGGLTNLTSLDLSRNELSGPIPEELGTLFNLSILNLSGNELSGPIPEELGSLTNLSYLNLWNNELSGPIPEELGSLTSLASLGLALNQLSGPIPKELGSLINLSYLILNRNQLSGPIPSELGRLTNLIELSLYSNQLSGAIPAELGSLTSLASLGLEFNQLSGAIPEELGSLTNLVYLYLNDNDNLTGTLPLSLTQLQLLEVFTFQDTSLCESLDAAFQAWILGVKRVDSTGCTNISKEEPVEFPETFALEANYPNPFNPRTTISFSLPRTAHVELKVHNILGELVETLENQVFPPGEYSTIFEATGLASGFYYYSLTAGDFRRTRKMAFLK